MQMQRISTSQFDLIFSSFFANSKYYAQRAPLVNDVYRYTSMPAYLKLVDVLVAQHARPEHAIGSSKDVDYLVF